ncbi:glycosyltransferase family 25 protein [Campylobacter ureolyticus]|uniref:glycosyltransferase family 25 protein n=1 Tax=Campylobacter ureolyticus TaxID=827 RepID=UPI0026EA4371|nr:glycosyltransferase family 25 protein [Campylobacter ureolyticus]
MIDIYFISLKKDEKRRENCKRQFPKYYNNFIQVEAVDGREIGSLKYFELINPAFYKLNKLLSPSEVGCSLSHKKVYELFLKSEADYALILEDDIIGTDEDIEKVINLTKFLNPNSIFICGGQDSYSVFVKEIYNNFYILSKYSNLTGTCSYVITKNSAKKLLNLQTEILDIADNWERLSKDLNVYFSDIFIHPLDLQTSNIQKEREKRAFKASKKDKIKVLKYIFQTRLEAVLKGYKKIQKIGNSK